MLASGLNPISSPIMPHSQSSLKRASPDFWVMMVLFVDWPLSSLLVVAMGLSANVLPPTPYPLPLLFWLTNHPPGSVSMFYSTSLLLRWWVRTWLVRGVSWNDGYIQGHVWRQWLCAFCFLGGQWHVGFFWGELFLAPPCVEWPCLLYPFDCSVQLYFTVWRGLHLAKSFFLV